ncbi:restriction endonuclease subunit S [Paenibacillus ferrarius]|uniref:restriction endonuclease subunit S n=1 Tax=Paenibacillus ferrarius TaxID=1469647 RepID=UPI003D2A7356
MAEVKKQILSAEELLVQALLPEDEQPYVVPVNWVWVKLGSVIDVNPPKIKMSGFNDNDQCSFVPMAAVSDTEGIISDSEEREFKKVKTGYTQFINGDVIFAKITPCMENGKSAIAEGLINGIGYGSTEFYVLRTSGLLINRLLYQHVRSSAFRAEAKQHMTGAVGQQRVPKKFIEDYPFPLPPIAEQQRIVDRIESLFAKLDRAKELAQRALGSFESRKAAILHKAFTGKLTAKWREEHTLESAQNRLINIIKTRSDFGSKSKELVAYMDELVIDDVLDSNGWLHLKAILLCDNITCGGTPTGFIHEHEEIPFLKVYNIVDNKIAFAEKPQFTNRETHNGTLKSSKLKPNDVVMNIVGPPLRKIALIPEDYAEWNMNQAIVRFRTTEHILPKYLYYCLLNPATLDEVISETKGVVGQANISITQSRNLIIPVPSVPEQYEIVRMLDSLFDKEQKAKELSEVIDKIDYIKKAILARAFRGELGTNDPEEENATELLKQIQENGIR